MDKIKKSVLLLLLAALVFVSVKPVTTEAATKKKISGTYWNEGYSFSDTYYLVFKKNGKVTFKGGSEKLKATGTYKFKDATHFTVTLKNCKVYDTSVAKYKKIGKIKLTGTAKKNKNTASYLYGSFVIKYKATGKGAYWLGIRKAKMWAYDW